MSAAVRLEDVHKSFGANEVLRGVSFEVATGEVVAIIGRSGSGKSTALRCINRLEKIQSGRIGCAAAASMIPTSTCAHGGRTLGSCSRATTCSLI